MAFPASLVEVTEEEGPRAAPQLGAPTSAAANARGVAKTGFPGSGVHSAASGLLATGSPLHARLGTKSQRPPAGLVGGDGAARSGSRGTNHAAPAAVPVRGRCVCAKVTGAELAGVPLFTQLRLMWDAITQAFADAADPRHAAASVTVDAERRPRKYSVRVRGGLPHPPPPVPAPTPPPRVSHLP
jgi:hypothetical protein